MIEKMNVLFIITDQHRKDHLSCYGNTTLRTPHIDSIAEEGVRFNNYYCNTPICMPNRANFFTGTYPSVHGTRSNGINLNPDLLLISKVFRTRGYHTISIGKTHFNFYSRPAKRGVSSLENIIGWLHGDITSQDIPTPWYGFDEVLLAAGHGDWMAGHYFDWVKSKGFNQHEYCLKNPLALNENYYETEMTEEIYPTNYITEQTISFLKDIQRERMLISHSFYIAHIQTHIIRHALQENTKICISLKI